MTRLEANTAWRDAAIADGWEHKPTYGSSEPESTAAKLNREGWTVLVLTRSERDTSVHVWGPDGLAVIPGDSYDFAQLVAGRMTCSECKAAGVETFRVGWAGRVCRACLPARRATDERPGWCD